MKIVVFAHRLELGGTQINAIELAAQLRDAHGIDVVVHATEGPALPLLRAKCLKFCPAPDARFHPAPARIRTLREVVRREKPDLIHAWDWWQALEAYVGVYLPMGVPMVVTDMMMELTRSMPREVVTTFGFRDLQAEAMRAGWRRAHLLPPPVDTVSNAPGRMDGRAFRLQHGILADQLLVLTVSRLADVMKSDTILRSIRVVSDLGEDLPLKLVIVGDGASRPRLEAAAAEANRRLRRAAVVLTGPMEDPRAAYDAADMVLGMGGSALRALAHEKPVVVTGTRGFACIFSPQTASRFLHTGFFGRGDGSDADMTNAVLTLATELELREKLGSFGRDFVVAHHRLDHVATDFLDICRAAMHYQPGRAETALDVIRTAWFYLRERRFRVASRDLQVPKSVPPSHPQPVQTRTVTHQTMPSPFNTGGHE